MAIYAFETQPLIGRLDHITKQVCYADDSSSTESSMQRLRKWWDVLVETGPLYGCFPKGTKTSVNIASTFRDRFVVNCLEKSEATYF